MSTETIDKNNKPDADHTGSFVQEKLNNLKNDPQIELIESQLQKDGSYLVHFNTMR